MLLSFLINIAMHKDIFYVEIGPWRNYWGYEITLAVVDDLHLTCRTHGFDGVLDQIDQYLLQRIGIDLDFGREILREQRDLDRVRG